MGLVDDNRDEAARDGEARLWWILMVGTVCAALLVPALLAAPTIDRWFDEFRARSDASAIAAIVVVVLLSADIALPIPSSVVGAFAGAAFGLVVGSLLAFAGLMIGCLLGYVFASASEPRLRRSAWGSRALAAADAVRSSESTVALVICRPVPLLAEATVVVAGLTRLARPRFMAACAIANAFVALLFAGVFGALLTR